MTPAEARESLPDARRELAADLQHGEWEAVVNDVEHLWNILDAIGDCEDDVDEAVSEYNAAVGCLEAYRSEMQAAHDGSEQR